MDRCIAQCPNNEPKVPLCIRYSTGDTFPISVSQFFTPPSVFRQGATLKGELKLPAMLEWGDAIRLKILQGTFKSMFQTGRIQCTGWLTLDLRWESLQGVRRDEAHTRSREKARGCKAYGTVCPFTLWNTARLLAWQLLQYKFKVVLQMMPQRLSTRHLNYLFVMYRNLPNLQSAMEAWQSLFIVLIGFSGYYLS